MIRIALDAMGGDNAPREIVRGAVDACRGLPELGELELIGDEKAIRAELEAYGVTEELPNLKILHSTEVIEMGEHPVKAVRSKKDSSINRGVAMVRDGAADAFISAGSTGAMVAASLFGLRRIPGIKRPAIGTVLPTKAKPVLLLDAGATPDCTDVELSQFAMMGNIYSQSILGRENPVVGLLSIGGEDTKGNAITRKTFEVLRNTPSLNFRGNIESHDIFSGDIDVVVCDGFIGNVVLKTTESVARTVGSWLKSELKKTWIRKFGTLFLVGAFKGLKQKMDSESYGGAPLLGVNGTIIIAHGSSHKKAIFHSVRVAVEAVKSHVNEKIAEELKNSGTHKLGNRLGALIDFAKKEAGQVPNLLRRNRGEPRADETPDAATEAPATDSAASKTP